MRDPNIPRVAIISGRVGQGRVAYPADFAKLSSAPLPAHSGTDAASHRLPVPNARGGSATAPAPPAYTPDDEPHAFSFPWEEAWHRAQPILDSAVDAMVVLLFAAAFYLWLTGGRL